MRWLTLLLVLISSQAHGSYDLEHLVKVRLEKKKQDLTIAGAGLKIAGRGGEDPLVWDRQLIRFKAGRWSVSDPNGAHRWSVTSASLRISGDGLRSVRKEWPSRLSLVGHGNSFDIVGEINLREYLAGVVAHEMPRSWPLETLKAQAVAARSYALAVRNGRLSEEFHLESTVDDQVFGPLSDEQENAERVREAVRVTDGLVLTLGQQKILKAYYHADCGGHTVPAPSVWVGEPDSGTAVDESCPATSRARWQTELSLRDIAKRLGSLKLNPLSIVAFAKDSHVTMLKLSGLTTDQTIRAQDFRMRVGAQDVRSTNFDLMQIKNKIVLRGRGFGHGVGLCQWGSRAMGLKGATVSQILTHYYPKAALAFSED